MQNRDHKLINLETFVNEKLKVTKSSTVPDLISFLESKTKKEFEPKCKQLLEYLKNDSDLPIAELEDYKNILKKISAKYENGYDMFLVVVDEGIFYGTWDIVYYVSWNNLKGYVENVSYKYGFNRFTISDREISDYVGVFIITKNDELMEQIDYLIQNQN